MHGVDDFIVCLREFYEHKGRYIDGFDWVH